MFSEHSSHLSQHQLSCCYGNEARLCAMQPSFVIPTVVANWEPAMRRGGGQLDDLDYSIGHEALSKASSSSLTYPIKHGMVTPPQKATQKAIHNVSFCMKLSGLSNQHTSFTSILSCRNQGTFAFKWTLKCVWQLAVVQISHSIWWVSERLVLVQVHDWDQMERFWHQSFAHYLRIDSQDHNFILTEPPLNTPENRELTAEIMFETFGVPGLYIGVQAILALYASFAAQEKSSPVISFYAAQQFACSRFEPSHQSALRNSCIFAAIANMTLLTKRIPDGLVSWLGKKLQTKMTVLSLRSEHCLAAVGKATAHWTGAWHWRWSHTHHSCCGWLCHRHKHQVFDPCWSRCHALRATAHQVEFFHRTESMALSHNATPSVHLRHMKGLYQCALSAAALWNCQSPGQAKINDRVGWRRKACISHIHDNSFWNCNCLFWRERGEGVPPELSLDVARSIKERYSYLASDIIKVGSRTNFSLHPFCHFLLCVCLEAFRISVGLEKVRCSDLA